MGFDVTPNPWRLVTTGTFLFQTLKQQGFGLQDRRCPSREVQGWAGARIAGAGQQTSGAVPAAQVCSGAAALPGQVRGVPRLVPLFGGAALWHGCLRPARFSTSRSILPPPGQQDPQGRCSALPGLSPSPCPTCSSPQVLSSSIALHQWPQIWTSCVSFSLSRKGEGVGRGTSCEHIKLA